MRDRSRRSIPAVAVVPLLLLAAFAAAACGSANPPSSATPAASAATSGGAPPSPGPSDNGAAASDEPIPSDDLQSFDVPSYTPDPPLEAMLPATFQGVAFERSSLHVSDVSDSGGDQTPFDTMVTAMGADPTKVSMAFSGDPTGVNPVQFMAYRFPGADPAKLLQVLVEAGKQAGQKVTEVTLGGRKVEKMEDLSAPDSISYLYVKGEVVLGVVAGDDATAAKALALLP